jgi:hypothetical protein
MAHRRCFSNESDKINSGIYTSRKKARTIYRGGVDLAKNNGVYHKSTNGKPNGTYVGDVKVSQNGSKCLNGATSYETLLSVTQGKYLESPGTVDLRTISDIWTGNIYVRDMSGSGLYTIDASAGGTPNTFTYPPSSIINGVYPTPLNGNGGLIVDPCFNVFYPTSTSSNSGSCYLKDERAYQKDLNYIDFSNNKNWLKSYIENSNGYTGSFSYPQKFVFNECTDITVLPGGEIIPAPPAPAPAQECYENIFYTYEGITTSTVGGSAQGQSFTMTETAVVGKITTTAIGGISGQALIDGIDSTIIKIRSYVNDVETTTSPNALSGSVLATSGNGTIINHTNPYGGGSLYPVTEFILTPPIELINGTKYVVEWVLSPNTAVSVYVKEPGTYSGGQAYDINGNNLQQSRDSPMGVWKNI